MKNWMFLATVLFGFGLGCLTKEMDAAAKPPQLTSTPTLTCNSLYDCGQYVVEIDTQRGFGPGFKLYQVSGSAIDTSSFELVSNGYPSISFQANEPGSRSAQTFTVTAGEP